MAIAFAIRSGLRDSREGRAPYLWSLFSLARGRGEQLRQGWRDVGKVLIAAAVIDLLYQRIFLRAFHLEQAVTVAVLLAIVPYVVFRGPINRLFRARR